MFPPPEKIPRHIAIIMDGNGRWAVRQGMQRVRGHERGVESVKRIVTECAQLRSTVAGPDFLTLYSFSIENWKRPPDEVAFLMHMYVAYLRAELPTMLRNNIRFKQIGRREGLASEVLDVVDETVERTKHHDGLTLSLAINYGSRAEIVDAVREIAMKVQGGAIAADSIGEETIAHHLYTRGYPDVDLLIRTAGEMRISNYLLWQISYAELVVTETLWPEFGPESLREAIIEFASRNRRFGGLDKTNSL